jgi:hypothetical protein
MQEMSGEDIYLFECEQVLANPDAVELGKKQNPPMFRVAGMDHAQHAQLR